MAEATITANVFSWALRPTLSPGLISLAAIDGWSERFLGSSAVADSGCRLISQARITVDPGALLIGSSVFKERAALVERAATKSVA
jgi:hypothetical protein